LHFGVPGFNPCRVFSGLATGGDVGVRGGDIPVSIPVGFFQALQLYGLNTYGDLFTCFNPCRVFSGLATLKGHDESSFEAMFQSLSGFFRPCNSGTAAALSAIVSEFQSLSGFFRPCNFGTILLIAIGGAMFQSLSGFFRPCNITEKEWVALVEKVSIPVGFFQALQLRGKIRQGLRYGGFNPCRVFSGLATLGRRFSRHPVTSFQSLSGFFRPCNIRVGSGPCSHVVVSIPVGFFQALQPAIFLAPL